MPGQIIFRINHFLMIIIIIYPGISFIIIIIDLLRTLNLIVRYSYCIVLIIVEKVYEVQM